MLLSGKAAIQALVEKYQGLTQKDKSNYNEANTVNSFIRPLFEALGWDFSDIDEVEAEKAVIKGRVDYVFKVKEFSIYAIVLNDGSCPAIDFLEQVKQNNLASHKSLVNIYTRHADHGQIRNIRKSRAVKGRRNILEFKSKQGDRLLYFYLPGRKAVFTHGFYKHKGASAKAEYNKAERMRSQYLEEVGNG